MHYPGTMVTQPFLPGYVLESIFMPAGVIEMSLEGRSCIPRIQQGILEPDLRMMEPGDVLPTPVRPSFIPSFSLRHKGIGGSWERFRKESGAPSPR